MTERNSRETHELQEFPGEIGASGDGAQEDRSQDIAGLALPPSDGGKAAWTLLLAAFVFEALLWGQLNSPLVDKISNVNCSDRLSTLLRRVPGFLFATSAIQE